MMRMQSVCKKPGCPALVEGRGYCLEHAPQAAVEAKARQREAFDRLESSKTPEERAVYASRQWNEARARHRRDEPLCRRCRAKGLVVPGELVHHNPALNVLLARGDSPYDDQWLETLCNQCHMKELRAKRNECNLH